MTPRRNDMPQKPDPAKCPHKLIVASTGTPTCVDCGAPNPKRRRRLSPILHSGRAS